MKAEMEKRNKMGKTSQKSEKKRFMRLKLEKSTFSIANGFGHFGLCFGKLERERQRGKSQRLFFSSSFQIHYTRNNLCAHLFWSTDSHERIALAHIFREHGR